eukprot:1469041-Pyramimonas_sp.AAC.1
MNDAREFGKQGVEDESADAVYREGVKRVDDEIMSALEDDLQGWTFRGNGGGMQSPGSMTALLDVGSESMVKFIDAAKRWSPA